MTPFEILFQLPKAKRANANWILQSILKKSHSQLLLDQRTPLNLTQAKAWKKSWSLVLAGWPLQYAVASAPFYGREFYVDRRVLIPRPETEVLISLCLDWLSNTEDCRVLDIGTGSGCVGLTLAAERPSWSILASDVSKEALKVAKLNRKKLGVKNLRFSRQSLFSDALAKKPWSLVVSNPPYLDFSRDSVAKDVKHWEPKLALQPGLQFRTSNGLTRAAWMAHRILDTSSVARVGKTALEVSPRVARSLYSIWKHHLKVDEIRIESDLAGRKRFLLVAWKNA